jgi:hypothetical protein
VHGDRAQGARFVVMLPAIDGHLAPVYEDAHHFRTDLLNVFF